ncbi:MAG: hypothetical protein RMK20_07595 [Verrucomicrobiales bacterium]|nr:hypothetical protein [Verrucomicrobiales bacterium]
MHNEQKKELCLALLRADSEAEVIQILSEAGFWDNPRVWRLYGDRENNFSTIGNQQNRPEAALVEKLVNAVDARLMHECLARGIDPESADAPKNIREAVAKFFDDGANVGSIYSGQVSAWDNEKRREIARGITLAATGMKPLEGDPCISIADCGEGQTPRKFPETFLSLERSNKLRIPFVQGKFNMGGTGVLEFCGKRNLQLILSRRSPRILNGNFAHPTDDEWGFTVVRREDPSGNRRSSSYTYLAPVGADERPHRGEVLSFAANSMPIFPDGPSPYVREAEFGTLVKLYEYSMPGHRSHILRKSGLLARLELLIPEPALPVRLYECRPAYGGDEERSYETNLAGLVIRLEQGKGDNLEPGFPVSGEMTCAGELMTATIYAFKKGRAETYRKSEGIIFTVNGQTHGYLTLDFFRRAKVGLSYLADSILVLVDCTRISGRGRELLFMNSRDRLRDGELRKQVEQELEELLKNQPGLRALRERRRREEIESRIEDAKPFEQVLESVLKHSPTLASLFLPGKHASNPFKHIKSGVEEKPYKGKPYPTYFKFKGKDPGHHLQRGAHINMRCRIAFETDAVNDYFSRSIDPGTFTLFVAEGNNRREAKDLGFASNVNLQNGIANLSIKFPENCKTGDKLTFFAVVNDATQLQPFENTFSITLQSPVETPSGTGDRTKPPSEKEGDEREIPGGLDLPKPTLVTQDRWNNHNPPFDKHTALVIKDSGKGADASAGEPEKVIYDFFINADNVHLQRYLKYELRDGVNEKVAKCRFELGMVLIGLALIYQENLDRKQGATPEGELEATTRESIEQRVADVTRALAPFLLPMIDALGALDEEKVAAGSASGEAT